MIGTGKDGLTFATILKRGVWRSRDARSPALDPDPDDAADWGSAASGVRAKLALLRRMLALVLQQLGQQLGVQLALALRLYAGTTLGPLDAFAHVQAATAAATDEVSVELLLGVAYVESHFDVRWVSRIEGKKRVYSKYTSSKPPPRWKKGTPMYCGPLQTRAMTWDACLHQRDLSVAYHAAVAELTAWLNDRRVRGDITRALAGYACGNKGVRTGKCNRYPGRVLYQARRLGGTRVRASSRS